MDRVGVDVVEPREIGALIGEVRIPILKPNAAARRFIQLVEVAAGLRVKNIEQLSQNHRGTERNRHEVIMVGKDGPGLEF